MKSLVSILILVLTSLGHAEIVPQKNGKLDIPGVGQVRIHFDEVGEPISQPERVEVFVTCKGTKSSFRAAVFRMCTYQEYSYEPVPKILTIKMFYGRVNPRTGDVICDQFDMKNIELANICDGKH